MRTHITVLYDDDGRIRRSMYGNHIRIAQNFMEHHQITELKTGRSMDDYKVGVVTKMPLSGEKMSLEEIAKNFRVSRVDGEAVELEQI